MNYLFAFWVTSMTHWAISECICRWSIKYVIPAMKGELTEDEVVRVSNIPLLNLGFIGMGIGVVILDKKERDR